MAPKLNISLSTPNLAFSASFILRIYGATKPGVPHLTKMYRLQLMSVASPKSTIFTVQQSSETIMFSGLMSLCTILSRESSLSPLRSPLSNLCLCQVVGFLFFLRKDSKLNPWIYSIERQRLFFVQQTPYKVTRLGCLTLLINLTQFSMAAFPSFLKAGSFINALIATLRLDRISSARQTVAKFPFPIFFKGRKNS